MVPSGCCTDRSSGLSGTMTSSNSSCEMALMVYESAKREPLLWIETNYMTHTYANDQRADGDAGDGVLDQVRRAGSQQGRRCPHAVVIVGRAEGFAGDISKPYCQVTIICINSLSHGGVRRLSSRRLAGKEVPFAAVVRSAR